jgi:hypothetical protein
MFKKKIIDKNHTIFKIAIATPYPVNDIIEFIKLSGLTEKEAKKILVNFSNRGISNLKDVSILIKLGYFQI